MLCVVDHKKGGESAVDGKIFAFVTCRMQLYMLICVIYFKLLLYNVRYLLNAIIGSWNETTVNYYSYPTKYTKTIKEHEKLPLKNPN